MTQEDIKNGGIKDEYAQKIRELKQTHEQNRKQENNPHIKPSSSRQTVEIDKITQMLKSSIESTSNPKEKTQEETIKDSSRKEEIVENFSKKIEKVKEEKTNIPHNNKNRRNPINYILILIIIVLGYFVYDKDFQIISKSITDISKELSKPKIEKIATFDALPQNIQKKFTSIESLEEQIEKTNALENEVESLKDEIQNLHEDNLNITSYMLEQFNDFLITEENLKNEIFKLTSEVKDNNSSEIKLDTIYSKYDEVVKNEIFPAEKPNSKEYKIVKCYDMNPGEYYLSSKCKNDIKSFLLKNENAKKFEIIGVVDSKDFSNFVDSKQVKNPLDVKKYNDMGLARYRVLETSWFITETLGKNVVLAPVNYTISSKKSNRGTIIRAYF